MKIVLVSTYDTGGAARATIRLHLELLNQGHDSSILVLKKQFNIPKTIKFETPSLGLADKVKRRTRMIYLNRINRNILQAKYIGYDKISIARSIYDIENHPSIADADIINLNWVADFIDYPNFFKGMKKPIVWTLHDMNPFTGGCHYADQCKGFENDCIDCPQIAKYKELIALFLKVKMESLSLIKNLTIVTPSKWLGKESSNSSLFKPYEHRLIPYGIDLKEYFPIDKQVAKKILNIPNDRRMILFVADYETKRKGINVLIKAIELLNSRKDFIGCYLGNLSKQYKSERLIHLGKTDDERFLNVIYNAADIFVIPSLEDNLPNTILESLACGVPVVGSNIGGIPDLVKDNWNGYLFEKENAEELAEKLTLLLDSEDKRKEFGKNAREFAVENLSAELNAANYLTLFKTLLD